MPCARPGAIRRNLVRLRREADLGGDCGLASLIVDITATQFNDSMRSDDAGEPPVFGVLVTCAARVYHRPVAGRGRRTFAYLRDVNWYEDQDHRGLRAAMKRLAEQRRY